jgi:hypothetical protein
VGRLSSLQRGLNSTSLGGLPWVAHGFSRGGRESPFEFVSPTSEEECAHWDLVLR